MSYAEGSGWNAYEVMDQVYVGGPHSHPLKNDRNLTSQAKSTNDLEQQFKQKALNAEMRYELSHPTAIKHSFNMRFACQYKITGLFKSQLADGNYVSLSFYPNAYLLCNLM